MTDPVDFIPAAPTWLGRRATGLPGPHGSFYRMPPAGPAPSLTEYQRPSGRAWARVLGYVLGTAAFCAGVVWFIINCTRV